MLKVYFISGHRDITDEEFQKYYENKIFDAINEDASFVVGDCQGVDIMAQKFLKSMMVSKVTVYHMFEEWYGSELEMQRRTTEYVSVKDLMNRLDKLEEAIKNR